MVRLSAVIVALFALSLSAGVIYFTPTGLTELKPSPRDEAETVQMLKPGALIEVKSIVTDTLGKEWYMVRAAENGVTGFVPSSTLELLGDEDKAKTQLTIDKNENTDKKRRLTALKGHPDWPRRIQSAIRSGTLCLKMSQDQLFMSWQKPYQQTRGFILGFGEVKILFYREAKPVAVVIKNDEIVGWSEKE
ncbi:MAG: hypothetical protein V1913_10075 [Fibrobacterota bacterium]